MDRKLLLAYLATALAAGCGSGRSGDDDDSGDVGTDADTDADTDTSTITGTDTGTGTGTGSEEDCDAAAQLGCDHALGTVTIVQVSDGSDFNYPTDLEFAADNPTHLWVVNRDDDSWTIVEDVGTAEENVRRFYDNSAHFLNAPSGLAFVGDADDESLATCMENNNDRNGLQAGDYWMGPVGWTSDRYYFNGGGNSHWDMAHEESWCMGIAWSEDHVFWTFNGNACVYTNPDCNVGALDRVDFNGWDPTGLGGENHEDGVIYRYAVGEVERIEDVPSHLVHNPADNYVYFSDSGNGRLAKIDATYEDGEATNQHLWSEMDMYACDATTETVVAAGGSLDTPSGIALYEGMLFVTDYGTGVIRVYTTSGEELNYLDTGLGADRITGITLSPDGVVYFLDSPGDALYRVEVPAT